MAKARSDRQKRADRLVDLLLRGLIGALLTLPYGWRVGLMGWLNQWLIAPLAGYQRRAISNLELVMPELTPGRRRQIARGSTNNVGRTIIENYSGREFLDRQAHAPIRGPGVAALETAHASGRPVILVSGHFGNYEAARAALVARGYPVGGLYRPMANSFFNDHYAQTMVSFGGPVFAQGRQGTAGFVRHLKAGGMLVLLFDQHVIDAPYMSFMGKIARTAQSAAELALRYDADLIRFFATRRPDGLSFDIEFEAPIEHSTPRLMTAAMNQSLEARIRQHPEQWFWIHRRWK